MDKLNDFQDFCKTTAVYPGVGDHTVPQVVYCVLGMNGEAGEAADHTKKILRDDSGILTDDRRNAVLREIGDVLWYVAMTAHELGYTLADLADLVVLKLSVRKTNNTIHGGDEARARHYEEILEGKSTVAD